MNKVSRRQPSLKALLLSYTALFILLVSVRNFQFWKLGRESERLVEKVSASNSRRSILTDSYKIGLDEQAIVAKLSNSQEPGNGKAISEYIVSESSRNDSLVDLFHYRTANKQEMQLLNQLRTSQEIQKQNRNQFLKLIQDGSYNEANNFYYHRLSHLYMDGQQTASNLLNLVRRNDNNEIRQTENQITYLRRLNIWISIALIIVSFLLTFNLVMIVKAIKNANLKLKESERKYRILIEQSHELIENCDAEGKLIFVNDAFKKALEYSNEELSNLTIAELLVEGKPNFPFQSDASEVVANVHRVLKSKSGQRISIEGTIFRQFKDGIYGGYLGFFKDVSQRKQFEASILESEQRFRNFFNLGPIPMWVIDPKSYKFVLVNKAAVSHYGYSEKEFSKMTLSDIIHSEISFLKIEDEILSIQNISPADQETNRHRSKHLKKHNEIIEVETYSSPININDIKCILTLAVDITERTRHENKITKAIIKTQEDERYEIGSELHDNVGQLLVAAKLGLGMIKSPVGGLLEEPFRQTHESLMRATEEVRNLSHRLAPAFFEDTRLDQAFESLLCTFNIENKYDIAVNFDEHATTFLQRQEIKLNLYRILQEQLKNIIKYAACSTIEIDVFIHKSKLKMRIADDGVGFDVNLIKRGIGLSNIKRRAELFSGQLQVSSSPGNGCEILIIIPINEII